MTAFLKIDECHLCHRSLPWEWIPAILLNGRALAGTGVWRSQLAERVCPTCRTETEARRHDAERAAKHRQDLLWLLGGPKPYRQFTFDRYEVTPENQVAYERSQSFSPADDNLYLWGPCGVGKTHLAWAVARRCFEESLTVAIRSASHLSRKIRMKAPEDEQSAIDELIRAEVLVLDDLGSGSDTAYGRQILLEILDARDFTDQGGLFVTSKYSLDDLAAKLGDDSIPSRLAGMCFRIEVRGADRRLMKDPER
jgi:DNA replication protein DnaC